MSYLRIMDKRCPFSESALDSPFQLTNEVLNWKINNLKEAVIFAGEAEMVMVEIKDYFLCVARGEEYSEEQLEWLKCLEALKKRLKEIYSEYGDKESFKLNKERYMDIYYNDDYLEEWEKEDMQYLEDNDIEDCCFEEYTGWEERLIDYEFEKDWNWQKDKSDEFKLIT